jgi:hypothetical protein
MCNYLIAQVFLKIFFDGDVFNKIDVDGLEKARFYGSHFLCGSFLKQLTVSNIR